MGRRAWSLVALLALTFVVATAPLASARSSASSAGACVPAAVCVEAGGGDGGAPCITDADCAGAAVVALGAAVVVLLAVTAAVPALLARPHRRPRRRHRLLRATPSPLLRPPQVPLPS